MTKVILQPGTLSQKFPNASTSQTYRIRIIAQVLQYNPSNATLEITSLPSLKESSSLTVNIFDQLEKVSSDVIRKGTIVNVEGFFDGDSVDVIDVFPVSGVDLSLENLNIIEKLNDLSEFKYDV